MARAQTDSPLRSFRSILVLAVIGALACACQTDEVEQLDGAALDASGEDAVARDAAPAPCPPDPKKQEYQPCPAELGIQWCGSAQQVCCHDVCVSEWMCQCDPDMGWLCDRSFHDPCNQGPDAG